MIFAWHFTDGWKLRDGQALTVGKTYIHDGPLRMCMLGLHASERALDALAYAPGSVLSRVECSADVESGKGKLVCRQRRVVAAADVTDVLRKFARWCALSVIDQWDAPPVVRRYLAGDDSLRQKARAAARTAWLVAESAASASWSAARAAAWSAESAARASWLAAESAARAAADSAARAAHNKKLTAMVDEALGIRTEVPMEITNETLMDMLVEIDESDVVSLDRWELDFVTDMIDRDVSRFSPKQAAKIIEIFERTKA